jgi:DNA-binding transcriptional ArsR family regulator
VSVEPDIAAVAGLLADETRAAMIGTLADGSARPASELAALAAVSNSTASSHLSKLVDRGLLAVERHGRHRYFRLAGGEVGAAIEALAVIAPLRQVRSLREATVAGALREARTCYDHLAGALGVALADALIERHVLWLSGDQYELGPRGRKTLANLGVDPDELAERRRAFARPCLDWSERRHHVGGALGAALAERFFALGWLERVDPARAVRVTAAGRTGFDRSFGLRV